MKKRTLFIILSTVLVVLVVSLGYATWTIQRKTADQGDGNFTAYSVEDSGEVKVTVLDNFNNIVFGKPSNYSANENDWLVPGSTDQAESLVLKVKVEFEKFDGFGSGVPFNVVFTMGHITKDASGKKVITDGTNNTVNNVLASSNYFNVAVTTEGASCATFANNTITFIDNDNDETEDTTGEITLVYTFSWNLPHGDNQFGTSARNSIAANTNPYTAYNALIKTEDLAPEAYSYLLGLYNQIKPVNLASGETGVENNATQKFFGCIAVVSKVTN